MKHPLQKSFSLSLKKESDLTFCMGHGSPAYRVLSKDRTFPCMYNLAWANILILLYGEMTLDVEKEIIVGLYQPPVESSSPSFHCLLSPLLLSRSG